MSRWRVQRLQGAIAVLVRRRLCHAAVSEDEEELNEKDSARRQLPRFRCADFFITICYGCIVSQLLSKVVVPKHCVALFFVFTASGIESKARGTMSCHCGRLPLVRRMMCFLSLRQQRIGVVYVTRKYRISIVLQN